MKSISKKSDKEYPIIKVLSYDGKIPDFKMYITVNGIFTQVSHLPEDPSDCINIRSFSDSDHDTILPFKKEITEYVNNFIFCNAFDAFNKPLSDKECFITFPFAHALLEILSVEINDDGFYCVRMLLNGAYIKATEIDNDEKYMLNYHRDYKDYIYSYSKAIYRAFLFAIRAKKLNWESQHKVDTHIHF